MKAARVLLIIAMLSALAGAISPAGAAKDTVCVLAGGVNLSGPANLVTTAYGTGNFAASALLRCVGAVGGQGHTVTSNFYFCQHNLTGPNPACHDKTYNGPNPLLDPVYDNINAKSPGKIVAHAKGSASFAGFTGGVSCSLTFEGHAVGTQAELTIQSFTCTNGFVMTSIKKAIASAVPVINSVSGCPAGPGGVKLCFKTLEFVGVIVGA
jgi:hypothetical protein